MNIVLWIVQIILAVKLLSVAYTHGVRPNPTKMQRGMGRLAGLARPLLLLTALVVFLGAAGLIAPAAAGVLAWLTPATAAALAAIMLLSIGLHVACRERPDLARSIIASLVLCALAGFVAYGRWALAPL